MTMVRTPKRMARVMVVLLEASVTGRGAVEMVEFMVDDCSV